MKPWALNQLIRRALSEDAVNNDITTNSLIPKNHVSQATIIVKEEAIVCGLKVAERVFRQLEPKIHFEAWYEDGSRARRNSIIAKIRGKTRTILTGERVALNFLTYLSGIATDTKKFVQKVSETKARILDTRKTTPGLRLL
ncbi:MAG TPA: nicotinate-nucleotide diphosphorylase (carboxylating), partial [Candidatus Omnitrophota bacterium]|nr:nicotinate-nucleotide diphosphorylase (carboxylating) [Candidatus Omnitrophota bacterium]